MRAIGIRVQPKKVIYTILESTPTVNKVLDISNLIVPFALENAEKLKYVRNSFLDILNQYNIKRAGIRITESNAQSTSIERISLESVIQEMLASSPVEKYFVGQISNISSKIGIPREDFKLYADGQKKLKGFSEWQKHSLEERESILTCLAAQNL